MAKKGTQAVKPAPSERPIRDRIVEVRRMRAGDLLPNPKNFRLHGRAQRQVLQSVLHDIGQTDALLAFPADGLGPAGDLSKLMLLDGHLRQEDDPDAEWTVLVTDLTQEEADRMLLVIDPLAAMAETSVDKLEALVAGLPELDGAVASMVQELQQVASGKPRHQGQLEKHEDESQPIYPIAPFPGEGYDFCAIFCKNPSDFAWLVTALKIPRVQSYKSKEVGIGRVITFEDFKKVWDERGDS